MGYSPKYSKSIARVAIKKRLFHIERLQIGLACFLTMSNTRINTEETKAVFRGLQVNI